MKYIYITLITAILFCNGLFAQSCLPNGIAFTTQQQIDDFAVNYPGCTEILGDIIIDGQSSGSITSLSGLSQLTTINGNLKMWNNVALPSLTGLDNLTYVGGYLWIAGIDALTDLTGLDKLTSIPLLVSLTALENVTSFNGDIWIWNNDALTSLVGLGNLDLTGIFELRITSNPNLSICALPNICNYLTYFGYSTIADNATNCNSAQEILDICITPIINSDILSEVSIFPNPNTGLFEITGIAEGDYSILNTAGQIIQRGQLSSNLSLDISTAPQGVYFMSIRVGKRVLVKRIVKI